MKIRITSFWPAISMIALATFLFCLPGNELPDADWLGEISADKIVHIGLFATLVALWGLPFVSRPDTNHSLRRTLLIIVVLTIAYGIAIEFIQGAYVPQRSFSVADMIADALGSVLGGVFVNRQKKTVRKP